MKKHRSVTFIILIRNTLIRLPGMRLGMPCEREGDFACDGDVDGMDVTLFQAELGRNRFNHPCTNGDPCNGDFDCDADVDGWDITV